MLRFPDLLPLAARPLPWIATLFLCGCVPAMPPPPDLGYSIQQRRAAVQLRGDASGDQLSAADLAALNSVLADARRASVRQVTVEVSGMPTGAMSAAIEREVRGALPQARLIFIQGIGQPYIVVSGVQAVATACGGTNRWFNDGLSPPGCAMSDALGRSVESPADLLLGRPPGNPALGPLAQDGVTLIDGAANSGARSPSSPPGSNALAQIPN